MKNNRWAAYLLLLIAASALFLTAALLKNAPQTIRNEPGQEQESAQENDEEISGSSEEEKESAPEEAVNSQEPPAKSEPKASPAAFTLTIPFLSQAPYAVWDPLHEDACEEASLIMVKAFFDKRAEIPLEQGENEIQQLVSYQNANGYGYSITLEELSRIAEDYFGMRTGRIVTNPTIANIKKEILAQKPVIIPAAGKILPNPNFRNGGPNYHMLVIKGFSETGFITNDPGTKKGNNFFYKYDELMNAIHDWDPQNIMSGQKAYLVFD